jgi:NAD(P)-dependent dehydrogenase (short-subunit alcohol dehydrogenase family)
VILLGRTRERLESVHDEIVAAGGPNPAIAVLDLASAQASDYYALADKVNAAWGRLDGLLHNAGVLGHRSPIEHYDVGTWHQVMHLNLNAPFIMTQVLLPVLRASPDASIVFTSSSVGRRGRAYWGAYAVSKFGIEGLAQVLADETANQPGLRVNCLNPGRARTAMRRAAYPGEDPASVPDPDSLMAPYLYLMSRASRGISGQSLDCQM